MIIALVQFTFEVNKPLQSGKPKYPSRHRSHLAPVISADLQVQFPRLLQVWLIDPLALHPQTTVNKSALQNPSLLTFGLP